MKHPRVIALSLSATVVGLTVWSFALEPASLSTREYRLSIPDWRADHAGLRIAVLADLHVGSPFNGITKLKRIVTTTNALKPDMILIPGDLVIHEVIGGRSVAPEDSAAVLATLTAPLGVWAVLGNHVGGWMQSGSTLLWKAMESRCSKMRLCRSNTTPAVSGSSASVTSGRVLLTCAKR